MGYQIELTEEDINDIAFVGGRYCWSEWARVELEEGINNLPEHKAWEFMQAIEEDTQGGHSYLPMLDPLSELYNKIMCLLDEIV